MSSQEEKNKVVSPTNVQIVDLVAEALNVKVIDRDAFSKKVNSAIVDFIVPRLLSKQMEIDGIIEVKK